MQCDMKFHFIFCRFEIKIVPIELIVFLQTSGKIITVPRPIILIMFNKLFLLYRKHVLLLQSE